MRFPSSKTGPLCFTGLLLTPLSATYAQSTAASSKSQIVVIGQRYGEAEVPSESELDERAIEDYGADSVGDLMNRIGPMIDGSDDKPVLIVNGKRIADPRDISGYPPEALQRVEILSREAAGRYGYAPGKRVVNLVLKHNFSGGAAQAALGTTTALGRDDETLTAQRVKISGSARWNADLTLKRESMLRDSDRTVPPAPGDASIAGNVFAASGELDPALSQAFGQPVTSAAVPTNSAGAPLRLDDFLAGANAPGPSDDARYRSLEPATRSAALKAGITQPIGATTLSLNLRAETSSSRRLLGLASASVFLPAGSPYSPFADDATLDRLLAGPGALVATQDKTSVGLSGNIDTKILGVHSVVEFVYDHVEARSRTERGFDLTQAAAAIANGDPAVDPFGAIPVGNPLTDRNRSTSDDLQARLHLDQSLGKLPAGPAYLTFTSGYEHTITTSRITGTSGDQDQRLANDQGDVRLNLMLPLASRRAGFLGALGELQAQLSGGALVSSGTPARTRRSAGIDWTPIRAFAFDAQATTEEDAPTPEQRNAPVLQTPGVRIYDYTTGTLAEVTQINGGNPDLAQGWRTSLTVSGLIHPWFKRQFMLIVTYQRTEDKGGVGNMPALTPVVEAAFPDRVQRDASGQLIVIDQRPINLARDESEKITSRLTLSFPFGAASPRNTAHHDGTPSPDTNSPMVLDARGRGRIQIALDHSWLLSDSLLIRQGVPLLDRLQGEGGGVSRHRLQLQLTVSRDGAGLVLDARWQSPYRTRVSTTGPSAGDLHFGALSTIGLRFNMDLSRAALLGRPAWLKRTQLSVDVDNLLDTRQHVTHADGTVPAGYTPDEIDPIGRTIRLSIRRRF